jgi:uncharacterized protein YbjT (DUF2867 family)
MILVAGGSGQLGRTLIPLLLERGEQIRVVTRGTRRADHLALPNVETIVGDIRDRDVVDRAVSGASTVISAIHGFGGEGALGARVIDRDANDALIDAAVAAGVDHFVLLSIHGASADHPIELFRMKAAAETRLKASGLSWTIVRPTAYQETWLGIIGGPLLETGRTRVFGRGRNPINFVASGDVARLVDQAAVDPGLRGATIDVAGPENLSFDQLVDVIREVTGVEGKVDHVPPGMLRLLSVGLRPFKPVLAGQMNAAVVMDSRDMTADTTERAKRFPSIPATRLEDVARSQLVDGTGHTPAMPAAMPSR